MIERLAWPAGSLLFVGIMGCLSGASAEEGCSIAARVNDEKIAPISHPR